MASVRRAALLAPALIDRHDSILLIIDLQDGFLKRLTPARREGVIDHCRFVVEAAVRLGIPLLVTVEDPLRHGMTTERIAGCIDSEIPQRDKQFFGMCSQPDLRKTMLEQPKRTAILIGMETDVCVLQSAVGLLSQGFRTVIVSDATESPGNARQHGLERAQDFGAELIYSRGLYYEWIRSVEELGRMERGARIAPPMDTVL